MEMRSSFSGDRWLVLADEKSPAFIETYRHIHSQLAIPNEFAKILIVFSADRVETLGG